jgi:hypothetical protein
MGDGMLVDRFGSVRAFRVEKRVATIAVRGRRDGLIQGCWRWKWTLADEEMEREVSGVNVC